MVNVIPFKVTKVISIILKKEIRCDARNLCVLLSNIHVVNYFVS